MDGSFNLISKPLTGGSIAPLAGFRITMRDVYCRVLHVRHEVEDKSFEGGGPTQSLCAKAANSL